MRRTRLVLARAAPRRLVRDPATSALVLAAFTLTALSAAAGPVYTSASADGSLHTVLDAVPPRAPVNVAAAVRVSGGKGPTRPDRAGLVDELADVPGLGPVAFSGVSVSPELQSSSTLHVSPLVRAARGDGGVEAVRLLGVADPAAHLVSEHGAADPTGDVWLPEPLAARLGAAPGSDLSFTVGDPLADPFGAARTADVVTVRLAGTYAVAADGRTPRPPTGDLLWPALARAGLPRDGLRPSEAAQLAIADVRTAALLGRLTGDDLLWTAEARVEGRPSLRSFHDTADAVDDLRRRAAVLPVGRLGDVLQPLVASGIADLDEEAVALAAAAQRGTALAVRVAITIGLVLTLAAAMFLMGRRRRELALLAGNGASPASAAAALAWELLPLAVLAWVIGWAAAPHAVDLAVAGDTSTATDLASLAWSGAACVAGLACCAVAAAAALVREQRRFRRRAQVRVPWAAMLAIAAGAAVAGLLGRPDNSARTLGLLDLLVPALVAGAVAAVGSRLGWLALRRAPRSRRRPRPSTAAVWIAARRLRDPDPVREATTALAAMGLALLSFSVAALASLEATVADRSTVATGAVSRWGLPSSWRLDDDAPRSVARPPGTDPAKPVPLDRVPIARTPPLPRGQSVVWHGDASLAASAVRLRILAIDPHTFGEAADWGSPRGQVEQSRDLLPELATDGDDVARRVRSGATPAVPALLVGDPDDPRMDAITAIGVIETGRLRLSVDVRHTLAGFPGTASGPPTLVLPEDPTFALAGNDDPRLRPPAGSGGLVDRFLPGVFPELWSDDAEAAAATLERHAVEPRPLAGVAQVAADPLYVAGLQSRRFHLALGVLFAALGLLATAAAAVQRARRTPAADVMVSWSGGTHGRTTSWARDVEVLAGLLMTAALAWLAVEALRPLAHLLIDPGDGRPPVSSFVEPLSLAWVAGGWLALALGAALLGGRLAGRTTTDVEALRGED